MQADWTEPIKSILPAALRERVLRYAGSAPVEEIRIRCGRPVQLVYAQGEELLPYVATADDCALLLERISEHSVYAFEEELKSCYITIRGGCRVGLCGRVRGEGERRRLTDAAGVNIRIARECTGCADGVAPALTEHGRPQSTLIFSAPGVGKTTMLRDIARQFSYGLNGITPRRVCIADERGELAGAYLGRPTLDVGPRTDVMDGCKKADAMRIMVRVMSPEIIITDELGGVEDAEAALDAAASGVAVIASAHAASIEELISRSGVARCVSDGLFRRFVWLTRERGRVDAKIIGAEDIGLCGR